VVIDKCLVNCKLDNFTLHRHNLLVPKKEMWQRFLYKSEDSDDRWTE